MDLSALILNCTLKYSPETSNTRAPIDEVIDLFKPLGVKSAIIRVSDYAVKYGVTSHEGDGDEWPKILKKIKAADILICGTPIWFGVRSSIAQLVIERLDGTYQA